MVNQITNTVPEEEALNSIAAVEYLPAPSPLLARLLASITDNDTTFTDISSIIESDAAITSQLLKIANSAYYGLKKTVNKLEHAVMLIGIREVRNLCLTICLVKQFNPRLLPKNFDLYTFWTHNLMTSFCCKEITSSYEWVEGDEIYLMGLLHDLGRLALAAAMPEKFNNMILLARKKQIPISRAEELYGLPHTEVGKWIAVKWGFSEKLKAVLRFHHAPLASLGFSRECSVVQTGAYIAKTLEKGNLAQEPEPPEAKILTLAGVSASELLSFCEKAEKLQEEVEQIASVLVGTNI